MGTLNYELSEPKTPQYYITGGTAVNPTTNMPNNETQTNTNETSASEGTGNNQETQNLQRGKIGTITTSWKGFLGKLEDLPKRKTLLGE